MIKNYGVPYGVYTVNYSMGELDLFGRGIYDMSPPVKEAVNTAEQLVKAAVAYLHQPQIDFDEDDGSLNFDLHLETGETLFIELYPDGRLFSSLFNEGETASVRDLSSSDLVNLMKEGRIHADHTIH